MKLSDISVTRPVLATVMSLLLVAFGLVAFDRLPLREYPDIDPPVVSIETVYPGAAANVVETRITQLIEDRIAGVEGIRTVESSSQDGRSEITVQFDIDRDIDGAANDIRDRVSGILDQLPVEAEPPDIQKVDSNEDVIMWLNLVSDRMTVPELTDYARRYLVDRFSVLDGVARVRVGGNQTYAMRVWIDRSALAARGLTVADVEAALRAENLELPAGSVESIDRQFTVRLDRSFRDADDFGAVGAGPGCRRLSGAPGRRRAGRARHRGRPHLLPRQRRADGRHRHHQAIHRQHHRRRRCRQGRDGPRQPEPARGHGDQAELRHLGVRQGRDQGGLQDARYRHRPGGAGDLPVSGLGAGHARAGRDRAGVAGGDLHGALCVGLLDQHPDIAGAGAGHRPGGGRRHRRAGEHPPAHGAVRRDAAGGGLPRHPAGRLRGGRDHGGAGGGVRAHRVSARRCRAAVLGICADHGRGGDLLHLRRLVAVADAGLADPAAGAWQRRPTVQPERWRRLGLRRVYAAATVPCCACCCGRSGWW